MTNCTLTRLQYFQQRLLWRRQRINFSTNKTFKELTLHFCFWKLNFYKYSLRYFRKLQQQKVKNFRIALFTYFKKIRKVFFSLRKVKKWRRKKRRIKYLKKKDTDSTFKRSFYRGFSSISVFKNQKVSTQLLNKLWVGFWELSKHKISYLSYKTTNNQNHTCSWTTLCQLFLNKKGVKKNYKWLNFLEKRRLNRLARFFKIVGFRKNKNRPKQPLQKTKKFKRYAFYKKIARLFSHKVTVNENSVYPLQSFRTHSSYYKMRWQTLTFMLHTQYPKNLNRTSIKKIMRKTHNLQKNKILTFCSKIELTLASLLLRLRLLATAGMADQFIKHGHVYVNYKKIRYPLFTVKPGDSISILVNPIIQVLHRFNNIVYNSRREPGLYRRNTARQSPTTYDVADKYWKTSLTCLNTITQNINSQLCQTVSGYRNYDHISETSDNDISYDNKKFENLVRTTSWKHGFISNALAGIFLKQNPSIDKISNILI